MSEYHKIETLYERDPKTFKLIEPFVLKNRVYGLLKTWHWTQKIDGTNIRCIWKDGVATFGGKTDNAQLPADLANWLNKNVTAEKFEAAFPKATEVILYAEGYGAGIQKGGNYRPDKSIILFDVRVVGDDGVRWWLSYENVLDVGRKMGLDVVPDFGYMTLEEATELVRNGIQSKIGTWGKAEGLVGRPLETLFDKKGARLIVKLKTKDFK